MDNLNFWFIKLCDIGKSSRAATNRDRVLSSGMFSDPLSTVLALAPDCLPAAFDPFLARNRKAQSFIAPVTKK